MMNRIYKHSALLVALFALASVWVEPVKLPLGIAMGGLIAIVNLRGMNRGLHGLMGTHRPTVKLVLLGIARLLIVFAIITALAASKAVNLIGFLVGFTVVLLVIVREGHRASKEETEDTGSV